MKTRYKVILALAALLSMAQLNQPSVAEQLLRDIRARFYNMQLWHQYATLYNDGTVDPYVTGFFAGYAYAAQADYNSTARLTGQGDLWIETP
jgi:hypothetical protein